MRVRRRKACVVQVVDREEPDFAAFLAGEMVWREAPVAELVCPFSTAPIPLTPPAMAVLGRIAGGSWTDAAALEMPAEEIQALVDAGVLVGEGTPLDAADERLDRLGWHPFAAAYHAATRWSG